MQEVLTSAWQQISVQHSAYMKSSKNKRQQEGQRERSGWGGRGQGKGVWGVEQRETLKGHWRRELSDIASHPGIVSLMLFCHHQQLPNPTSLAHCNLVFILSACLVVRDNQCHQTLIIVIE